MERATDRFHAENETVEMRILLISSFYPPYVVGGWEQLVQDINMRLQARGHVVQVLTSNHGVKPGMSCEVGVDRILSLESDMYHYRPLHFFGGRVRGLKRNLIYAESAIRAFNPDLIFIHVMWNLSKRIAWLAEQMRPGRVVYYMANDWPYAPDTHLRYWLEPAERPLLKMPKRVLGFIALKLHSREAKRYPLRFQHVLCVSHHVENSLTENLGIPAERMHVVFNGVDIDQFLPMPVGSDGREHGEDLSLLYAGSLVPAKGVHSAIEAMAILARKPNLGGVKLTLVGAGHVDYEASLRQLVERHKLADRVHFSDPIPRDAMPDLLRRFDALVFPSVGEALPRIVQEAMAVGLVVIGTTAGGTGEILVEGKTGLTFMPGDSAALACQIERISADMTLRRKLAANARNKVARQFDIRHMIAELEEHLTRVAQTPVIDTEIKV